jgi:hypothetical protein
MYIEEQIERFLEEEDFWRRRIMRESSRVLAEWAIGVRLELIMVDAFLRCTEERGTGPEEIILVAR